MVQLAPSRFKPGQCTNPSKDILGMRLASIPSGECVTSVTRSHIRNFGRGMPIYQKMDRNTFDWIYKDPTDQTLPWSSFIDFLEGENRLYWVHGKPGAGKSTLLKYLKHPRTEEALLGWAGGKSRLLRCSFFFWNSGLKIQRSEGGFLRALLWTILSHCLSTANHISPEGRDD